VNNDQQDSHLTDEQADLWAKVRCLTQMWRTSRYWESAYTETEWLRVEEFHTVRLQLLYDTLLELDPDDRQAQRGIELTNDMLASLDEMRHLVIARSIVRADGRAAHRNVDGD